MFLSEILNIIGNFNDIKDKKINNIRTDSRLLQPNDVFLCINSGYKYINDAINIGVCLIITQEDVCYDTDIPIIKVDNTIKVLGDIAKYIRKIYPKPVIAITGSNGKTTTKELLSYILEHKYKVLKNEGSQNNHIGVPNTLLNLNDTYDYVVLELGTNHPGEISYLSDIVLPDIALITNIGTSHIGNFKTLENIYKEKINIKKDNTLLFLNGEDYYLKNYEGIKVYKDQYEYKCSIPHIQIDYNLVFRVCEHLGLDLNEVYEYADKFKMYNSRMNIFNSNLITLIDDSYNASYESVIGGLNSLNKYNNKLIILGDMLELGDYSYTLHEKLKEELDKLNNYYLITIGNYTKVLNGNIHFDNVDDMINHLYDINYKDYDVIYIKGAHGINLSKIVPILKEYLQIK